MAKIKTFELAEPDPSVAMSELLMDYLANGTKIRSELQEIADAVSEKFPCTIKYEDKNSWTGLMVTIPVKIDGDEFLPMFHVSMASGSKVKRISFCLSNITSQIFADYEKLPNWADLHEDITFNKYPNRTFSFTISPGMLQIENFSRGAAIIAQIEKGLPQVASIFKNYAKGVKARYDHSHSPEGKKLRTAERKKKESDARDYEKEREVKEQIFNKHVAELLVEHGYACTPAEFYKFLDDMSSHHLHCYHDIMRIKTAFKLLKTLKGQK